MKSIYVSQISEYVATLIDDEFYVITFSKATTSESGIPYCNLTLGDKTGNIQGIVWDQHIQQISETLLHTIVRVKAEVYVNKHGNLELIIKEINKTHCCNVQEFINSLDDHKKDMYFTSLCKMVDQVKKTSYKRILSMLIFQNEKSIKDDPLSLSEPGNYNGAVLVQIVSVTSIAVQISRSHNCITYPSYTNGKPISEDLIITGSIISTLGDIKRFTSFPNAKIVENETLITNELRSLQLLEECLKDGSVGISTEEKNILYNIIHTVHNKTSKLLIREGAIIRSAYEIYRILITMDYENIQNLLQDNKLNFTE